MHPYAPVCTHMPLYVLFTPPNANIQHMLSPKKSKSQDIIEIDFSIMRSGAQSQSESNVLSNLLYKLWQNNNVKTQESRLVRNWSEKGFRIFLLHWIGLYRIAIGFPSGCLTSAFSTASTKVSCVLAAWSCIPRGLTTYSTMAKQMSEILHKSTFWPISIF